MKAKHPRPYLAGTKLADALCEVGNLLYFLDDREQFLQGLNSGIEAELIKVHAELQSKAQSGRRF